MNFKFVKIALLTGCILLNISVKSQDCLGYDKFIKEGNSYFHDAKYKEAVNKYISAMINCYQKTPEAQAKIITVFNEIEHLKNNAEMIQKKLEQSNKLTDSLLSEVKLEKSRTEKSKKEIERTLEETKKLKIRSDSLAKNAQSMLYTVYASIENGNKKYSNAFRIAELALKIDSLNSLASYYILKSFHESRPKFTDINKEYVDHSEIIDEDNLLVLMSTNISLPNEYPLFRTTLFYLDPTSNATIKIKSFDGSKIDKFYRYKEDIFIFQGDNSIFLYNKTTNLFRPINIKELQDAVFSPDGNLFATISKENTITVWDTKGKKTEEFKPKAIINSIHFSSDGNNLITANENKEINIYNLQGKVLKTLDHHSSAVLYSIYLTKDIIISSSADGLVLMKQNNRIDTLYNKKVITDILASKDRNYLIFISDKNEIILFYLKERDKEAIILKNQQDDLVSISFSNNDKYLLTQYKGIMNIIPIELNQILELVNKENKYSNIKALSKETIKKYNLSTNSL